MSIPTPKNIKTTSDTNVNPESNKTMNKLRELISKPVTKTTKFMGENIEIKKLTLGQVTDIQELAAKGSEDDEKSGLEVLKTVIRMSVSDAEDLSDQEFEAFPMDELANLSNAIMAFSGMAGGKGK